MGYSLQANVKTKEGKDHPDRDAQFRYINEQVCSFLTNGRPVISVDTKKKELIGEYKDNGVEWQPQGEPEPVQVHDFGKEKGIPHGVYDVGKKLGWVTVGCDHDTATFAVSSIRRWWLAMGRAMYPNTSQLLICADGGGSNGYRLRLWKVDLQRFADEMGLAVTVCHLPPGTSKWNKIEHRLFSHISMNWRGRPLISHAVVVQLIAAVSTRSGLKVRAELDRDKYPTGVEVTDEQIAALSLRRHEAQSTGWPPFSGLVPVRHPFGEELDPGSRPGTAPSRRRGRHDGAADAANPVVDGRRVCFHIIIICEIERLGHGVNIPFREEGANVRLKARLYRHN